MLEPIKKYENFEVYFKDKNYERIIKLEKPNWECRRDCSKKAYCYSAFSEYKVLEFYNNSMYEEIE